MRVRAPSQAALSHALVVVVWNVGAGMCVCACAVELAGPERGRVGGKGVTSGWEAVARRPLEHVQLTSNGGYTAGRC